MACESLNTAIIHLPPPKEENKLISDKNIKSTLDIKSVSNINGRLSLFFKTDRGLNLPTLYKYLSESSKESIVDTFLICFHLRDCRGGKGERELGRKALTWLFINFPDTFEKISYLIPEYGRWDDMMQFFPNVLNLHNINYVKDNFISTIPDENYLVYLRIKQTNIIQIFANKLIQDQSLMMEGKPCSLAAKWAPTENDSLDRKNKVYSTLANAMKISKKFLRKIYLTPLRAYLKVVECYMCTGRWDEINYNLVPVCAMKKLKRSFEIHDEKKYKEWKSVLYRENENKRTFKKLNPYEFVREIRVNMKYDNKMNNYWNDIEKEYNNVTGLKNSVIVVDNSGSMYNCNSIPFDIAMTMGLLISSCSGVFKNHVITFNTEPELIEICSRSIYDRLDEIMKIPWGSSVDIEKVFALLLSKAISLSIKSNEMPQHLWIISDTIPDNINLKNVNKMYIDSGYKRPELILWNMSGKNAIENFSEKNTLQDNILYLSGFSDVIMKSVLKGEYNITLFDIMKKTIYNGRLENVSIALSV